MKKVFYTFAFLAISLMSCESSSNAMDIPDTTDNSTILPTKIDIVDSDGATETVEYLYDEMTLIKEESSDGYYTDYQYEDSKLSQMHFYYDSDFEIIESYTYDAEDRVATITTNIVGTGTYEYSLTYNSDNTVITSKLTNFPDSENSTTTFSNGNMTNDNDSGEYITSFTHDTKNGPFKNLEHRAILLSISSEANVNYNFNSNNVLTSDTPHDSDPESISYSYMYTEFNYPRTVTENYNGEISTYTYTYNND